MDIITKFKRMLEDLYSNKVFRVLFFALFIILVIYKYSNVRNGIETIVDNPNIIEGVNVPKKISVIRKTQNTLIAETEANNKEKEEREEKIKKLQEIEQQKAEQKKKREEKIEELKKEFTSKTSRSSYILKSGDVADVAMLITNGDNYNLNIEPIKMPIKIDNRKNNIFGRKLIGKKVGQVVVIPLKDFLEDKSLRDAIQKVEKEQIVSNSDLKLDVLKNSQVVYRVKILGLSK